MSPPVQDGSIRFCREIRHVLVPAVAAGPAPLVVLLHGRGMSGAAFLELAALPAPWRRHVLAPDGVHALENRGRGGTTVGHSWYLYTGDQDAFQRELEQAEAHLLRLLDQVSGSAAIDTRRVTLVGFSQGGYLAGFMALRNKARVQGLVLVGSRLKHEFVEAELGAGDLPRVLFLHSPEDTVHRWELAAPGVERLRAAGAEVTVELHGEGHRVPADFAPRLERWLDRSGL